MITQTTIANEIAKANAAWETNQATVKQYFVEGHIAAAFGISFDEAAQIINGHMNQLAEIEADMSEMIEAQA